MTVDDWKALVAELAKDLALWLEYDGTPSSLPQKEDESYQLLRRARAVLARWGTSSGATLESGDKSTTQSKGLNRQEMKTFACEWWNKFGFVKDKATCIWVIDEIDPDHFVDFMFDVLAKYGNDTQPTEES